MKWFCSVFLVQLIWRVEVFGADVFTSTEEMVELISLQKHMLNNLESYIEHQEEFLHHLRNQHKKQLTELNKALLSPRTYVTNPINAFRILKQFHHDWEEIYKTINNQTSLSDFNNNVLNIKESRAHYYPDMEDFSGAIKGIIRLQELYQLKTEDLAEGIINGEKCSTPLEYDDCYLIGYGLFVKNKSLSLAKEWLTTSLSKQNLGHLELERIKRVNILDILACVESELKNVEDSLKRAKEALDINPNDDVMKELVIENENILKEREDENEDDIIYHGGLCRGETHIAENVTKILKCRYVTENHPYLKISPLKMEEMYNNPYVVMYHDVISENELQEVINHTYPNLVRARIFTGEDTVFTDIRISKAAWIDGDHKLAVKIQQKIVDMTDLVLDYSENLQVSNYGIGGFYSTHHDYVVEDQWTNYIGDRIATVLIYLTDVEQGGYTIFPHLNLAVKPKKGSAIFWYNLHPSGIGNEDTLHASCPVLKGNKWVMNMWVREKGNDVKRPCGLKVDDVWSLKKLEQESKT